MSDPGVVCNVLLEPSQHMAMAAFKEETLAFVAATLALFLAELKLVNTTPAKIPIIAMTTKSSIKVKPLFNVFFIKNTKLIIYKLLNDFIFLRLNIL